MPIPGSHLPEIIATPEGDNEFGPDTPLAPLPEGLLTPPGSAPSPYEADKTKPTRAVKFIDEIVRGEYM
jgi:hypothetical protein